MVVIEVMHELKHGELKLGKVSKGGFVKSCQKAIIVPGISEALEVGFEGLKQEA